MTNDDITDQACLQIGRTMLAFGLKYAMNLLQSQAAVIDQQLASLVPAPEPKIRPAMRRTMALIEEAEAPTIREMRKRKRAPSGIKSYWAQFTPEERSKEMKRRWRLGEKKRREAA